MPRHPAPRKRIRIRPNPKRQALLALLAVAAMAVGYAVAEVLKDDPEPVRTAAARTAEPDDLPKPWYRRQAPPPGLVTAPDAPLLHYEESLPGDLYLPPEPPPIKPRPPRRAVPAPHPEPQAEPQAEPQPDTAQPAPAPVQKPAAAPAAGMPAPAIDTPPPWRANAVTPPPVDGRAMIAVIIDDMGVDTKRSARVVALPGPLTLSMLPYGDDLPALAARGRTAGHELMVHVSMEPSSSAVDPGPNVLLAGMPPDEIRRRLGWALGRFAGYVGINNHMGSRFTADAAGMAVVLDEVARRGLLFVDSRTTNRTAGPATARRLAVPYADRNVFLDNEENIGAVKAQLAKLESAALSRGYAVGIGHPRDATIAALAEWLPSLAQRGFALVPVSTVVGLRHSATQKLVQGN